MNDRALDERIRRAIQSIEAGPPPPIDLRRLVLIRLRETSPARGLRSWLAAAAVSAAALALAVGSAVLARKAAPAAPAIAEIRTDFEIPEKNIRIIFYQRADFRFLEEK